MKLKKEFIWLKDIFPEGLLVNSTLKKNYFVFQKEQKPSAYFGVDLTGGELHLGHFLILVTLKRLSLVGFKPIVLLGTGTTRIGDPSGKEKERKLLLESKINTNFNLLHEKLNFAWKKISASERSIFSVTTFFKFISCFRSKKNQHGEEQKLLSLWKFLNHEVTFRSLISSLKCFFSVLEEQKKVNVNSPLTEEFSLIGAAYLLILQRKMFSNTKTHFFYKKIVFSENNEEQISSLKKEVFQKFSEVKANYYFLKKNKSEEFYFQLLFFCFEVSTSNLCFQNFPFLGVLKLIGKFKSDEERIIMTAKLVEIICLGEEVTLGSKFWEIFKQKFFLFSSGNFVTNDFFLKKQTDFYLSLKVRFKETKWFINQLVKIFTLSKNFFLPQKKNSYPKELKIMSNQAWFEKVNLIDFLRNVGKKWNTNSLLKKEVVKKRIESEGLSFAEFSYSLLQGYDFLQLFERENCTLQIGGSDQWGNITLGVKYVKTEKNLSGDLISGITLNLLTTKSGRKFGKTEENTFFLFGQGKNSLENFCQFFLNLSDDQAKDYLRFFTFLEPEKLEILFKLSKEEPQKMVLQNFTFWVFFDFFFGWDKHEIYFFNEFLLPKMIMNGELLSFLNSKKETFSFGDLTQKQTTFKLSLRKWLETSYQTNQKQVNLNFFQKFFSSQRKNFFFEKQVISFFVFSRKDLFFETFTKIEKKTFNYLKVCLKQNSIKFFDFVKEIIIKDVSFTDKLEKLFSQPKSYYFYLNKTTRKKFIFFVD